MIAKRKTKKKQEFNEVEELIELGKFYFINQKFDQAIKEFKRALALDPSNSVAVYNLAIAYEASNNKEEAKVYYERTLELSPDNELARQRLDKLIGE